VRYDIPTTANAKSITNKYQLIELDTIDSTNTEAKRLVSTSKATSSIIFAHTQTSGRGRYSRTWESGKGNLYMSILIPLEGKLAQAAELSFVMGLATYEAISSIGATLNIKLKWPNDIFIGDNKVGGILLESISYASQTWIIIGLGLNIKQAHMERSSSLMKHGLRIGRREMLDLIIQSFEKYYNMWKLTGFTNIHTLWLQHAYRLGMQVNIGDVNTRISGIFESIDKSGAMVIRLESGEIYKMSIGEMFF
jgi:BirA family biotin operon repressor/biotin-[acetyl-CoA-carboxylase] ligase